MIARKACFRAPTPLYAIANRARWRRRRDWRLTVYELRGREFCEVQLEILDKPIERPRRRPEVS